MNLSNWVAIIPAHNEAASVADVVKVVRCAIPFVLVIDDASHDGTAELAASAGARVLSLQRHSGYSETLRAALPSLPDSVRHIVTMDADGAHDPDDLLGLVRSHLENDNQLTIGNRFATGIESVPSSKRWANYFATALVNAAFGSSLEDVACGFRAMTREAFTAFVSTPITSGFELPYDSISIAARAHWRIGEQPVRVRYNAAELACTHQRELLDLLASVHRHGAPVARDAVATVAREVENMRPFSARLARETVCWHPIPHVPAYIAQQQHHYFTRCFVGSVVALDSIPELKDLP